MESTQLNQIDKIVNDDRFDNNADEIETIVDENLLLANSEHKQEVEIEMPDKEVEIKMPDKMKKRKTLFEVNNLT